MFLFSELNYILMSKWPGRQFIKYLHVISVLVLEFCVRMCVVRVIDRYLKIGQIFLIH